MTTLFNLFIAFVFSLTLVLVGGCDSERRDAGSPAEKIPIFSVNLNGAFKNHGDKYSLSGTCEGSGEITYKIGGNPKKTVNCVNDTWEVVDIIPTLDDGQSVSEGNKVAVKVSFVGNSGKVFTVSGTLTIDRTAPVGRSIAVPPDSTYPGRDLDFVVSFDEKVFVNAASGIPSLALTLGTSGGASSLATYVSGSGTTELSFRYEIQDGDQDGDGIGLANSIELNSGTIKDQAGNDATVSSLSVPSLGGVKIATTRVTLNSVSAVAASYGVGGVLELTAIFSETVNVRGAPQLQLAFANGGPSNATYVSGDGSSTLIFSYTVSAGENDSDGIEVRSLTLANEAAIANQYGFAVAAPSGLSLASNVVVDTQAPELRGLADMSGGSAVSVKSWSWSCNDVSLPCTYRHTFSQNSNHQFGESDAYGAAVSADTPSGANGRWYLHIQAKDSVGNESAVSSYGVNLDGVAPLLVSEDIGVPVGATYNDQLNFTVKFNESVTVDNSGGTPRLPLMVGLVPKYANYFRGSGGTTLTFRYVVEVGDVDTNGVALGTSIDLNGGTIKDGAQNAFDANATLQVPSLETVLVEKTKGVTISKTTLAFGEASSGRYTVKLNSQPTQNVTVTPASGNTGVATVSVALLFTTSDWNTAQPITVTGVNDNIINASARTTTITHTISGGDYATLDITNKTVGVTLTDDDTGGVTLSVNSLTVGESGPTGTYTVVLTVQPSGNVVVTPASGNTGVATVSGGPLTFNSSNWTMPQTVTVTGVNDNIDNASDRSATITHTILGGGYNSVPVADVRVTLTDDDTKGVTISETTLAFGEASSGRYTVKLNSQPTQNVTVTPASGNTGVATVSVALLFTTSDWNIAQPITVTGVNDNIINASARATTITHTISGGDYATLDITNKTVRVTLTDDDTGGVTLSVNSLTVGESGPTGTYTVVLTVQPSGNVVVTPASGNTGVATVSGGPLTFNSSNWTMPQTVTVTGVNDNIDNASDRSTTITHTILGGGYNSVPVADVRVTLTDDDTKGVTISETTLAFGEASSGRYTVKLNSQPTQNVTVTPASGNTGVATVSVALLFTTSDWNIAQPITVTGVNDNIINASARATTITHTISGGDYATLDITNKTVGVTLADDDTGGVTLSVNSLTVGENGPTGTYTVVLTVQPSGNVVVTPASGNTGVATVSGGPLTFNSSDWTTPQRVTVTGVNDNIDNASDRSATITHTISGGGYNSVPVADVVVTVTDDDTIPTVVITGPTGSVNGPINLTITFSEAMSGFAKAGITVSTGTLGTLGTSDNTVFTITLTPPSSTNGSVTVNILSNVAQSVSFSNSNSAAAQYSVVVDNTAPGIVQNEDMVVPVDGNHTTGSHLDFKVKFTENVLVVGSPEVKLFIGQGNTGADQFSTNKSATYHDGSNTNVLTFRYTVVAGDSDSDGISLSNRSLHVDSEESIRDVAGNDFDFTISAPSSKFLIPNRNLYNVKVNSARNHLALQDRRVSTSPSEQTPSLTFDPTQIKGLSRWLDGADFKTLFSDVFCSTPLPHGESSLGCWSDKSGRGAHYFPVQSTGWPTLFDVLATEAERKPEELFAVTDHAGELDLLSFVYPYPRLKEETLRHLGEIREVVIYEESLEAPERAELARYLSCRWQLSSSAKDC